MIPDGAASYTLAIACLREKCIRSGQVQPRPGDAREARWQRAGTVPDRELETITQTERA